MYTLYYSPGTASMAVHQALLEIGVPFELRLVDFDQQQQRDPAYLRLNPTGKVPTLLIDGIAYGEAVSLLMLLAARHPQTGLAPATDAPIYAAWLQWMIYLDNTLMATFRLWFYPNDLGLDDYPSALRDALQARIAAVWDRLETHFATHGPYLLGEAFSCADLLLLMLMRWSRNMPRPVEHWPALKAYAARLKIRPSWQAVNRHEGLSGW